jgi:hypothetical protein
MPLISARRLPCPSLRVEETVTRATVRVIRIDEDVVIVKAVIRTLADMQSIQPIQPKE